jgi:hypothetical protein
MLADQRHDREAARSRVFDAAQALATALLACDETERWEPLRDLILAGLQAGGLRHPDASTTAVSTASSELAAAALDARRQLVDQTTSPPRRSPPQNSLERLWASAILINGRSDTAWSGCHEGLLARLVPAERRACGRRVGGQQAAGGGRERGWGLAGGGTVRWMREALPWRGSAGVRYRSAKRQGGFSAHFAEHFSGHGGVPGDRGGFWEAADDRSACHSGRAHDVARV